LPPAELGLGDRPLLRISVFMSVFNCHVNRSPVAGRIDRIRDEPYGQLLVSLVGGDVAAARARLAAAGVRVEEA